MKGIWPDSLRVWPTRLVQPPPPQQYKLWLLYKEVTTVFTLCMVSSIAKLLQNPVTAKNLNRRNLVEQPGFTNSCCLWIYLPPVPLWLRGWTTCHNIGIQELHSHTSQLLTWFDSDCLESTSVVGYITRPQSRLNKPRSGIRLVKGLFKSNPCFPFRILSRRFRDKIRNGRSHTGHRVSKDELFYSWTITTIASFPVLHRSYRCLQPPQRCLYCKRR